jgi:mannose-6-phosphate isomerase
VLPYYRTHYTPVKNEGQLLVECPYFNTAVYDLDEPMLIDYSELDSFVILIGLKGEGTVNIDGEETTLREGESILLPAYINNVRVEGTVKFLETYVLS